MKIARLGLDRGPRYAVLDEDSDEFVLLSDDPLFGSVTPTGRRLPADRARLVSPMIPRSKVVGFAGTYDEEPCAAPAGLTVFLKPNTAVIGPDAPIVLPAWSEEVHYEAELAVVIKRIAKDLSPQDAHRVILGYTVANDVSARDRQRAEPQWVRAKAFDTSCPLGPWIEIPEPGDERAFDPSHATVRARLDGETVQEGSTADMILGIEELVAYASTIFTLLPGDVILTGTPAGVGEIRAGQRVGVEVEGIGGFTNPVVRR